MALAGNRLDHRRLLMIDSRESRTQGQNQAARERLRALIHSVATAQEAPANAARRGREGTPADVEEEANRRKAARARQSDE